MTPRRHLRARFREMRRLISADVDLYLTWPLMFNLVKKERSRWSHFCYLLLTVHSFPPVLLYRVQTFLYESGFHRSATTLSRLNHFLYGVTIGNHVRTSGGLLIAHGHVVLDGFTFLGDRVHINPFVTLGVGNSEARPFELWGPVIGNDVNIGTGAKILGKVNVGDGVKIGANAVVVSDIPAHHTAVGVPARSFPTAGKPGEPVPGQAPE